MILASDITDSVSGTLLDRSHRGWPVADLLVYVNEFLKATAFVKPDMFTVQSFLALAAGTLQTLPADAVGFISADENQTGRTATQCDYDLLQESNRFWPAGTQQAVVENWCVDPRNPRRYIVSPPNDGTGHLRVLYGAVPPAVTATTDNIDIPASYTPAAIAYVLSCCYRKNSKRQDLSKSASCYQEWAKLVGMKSQAQIGVSPKVAAQPGTTS